MEKSDYITLQYKLRDKMKTSNDPQHWSACIDMLQEVIDAEYGDMANQRMTYLGYSN